MGRATGRLGQAGWGKHAALCKAQDSAERGQEQLGWASAASVIP